MGGDAVPLRPLPTILIASRYARLVGIVFLDNRRALIVRACTRPLPTRISLDRHITRGRKHHRPISRRVGVRIKPEMIAHLVERHRAEFQAVGENRFGIAVVFVEPVQFQIRRGELFGDDLVDEVLHPLLCRLEAFFLALR